MKTLTASFVFFLCGVLGIRETEVLVTTKDSVKVTITTVRQVNFKSAEIRDLQAQNAKVQASLSVLEALYKYDEVSKRVERLQRVLGNVRVDSHYGEITRQRHLEALEARGLPVDKIPSVGGGDQDGKYNISDNLEHRCPMWEEKFKEHGLEPVEVFSYIAYRESRCRPAATNAKYDANGNITWTLNKDKSIDRGLLQINSSWQTVTSQVCKAPRGQMDVLFDVDCNLSVAKYILDNSTGKLSNWRVWAGK